MDEPTTLAQVIDLAYAKHRVKSSRKLAEVSKKLGVPISYTTISQMHRGAYGWEVGPDLRNNLHRLSGVSRAVIDRIVNAPSEPFRLPASADELTGDQREAVLGVVRAFAKANRQLRGDEPPAPTPIRPKSQPAGPAGGYVIEEEDEMEDDEQVAAYESPEPAGQPEPEQP